MKLIFVALFLLTFAAPGLAQTVTVRAGEHDEFTRIVLRVPDGIDWEIGRIDSGYALQLSQQVSFDTDNFFSIIPKDRISAVSSSADGKRLNLTLNCNCSLEAYLTETRWLVVDVSTSPPLSGSPFEIPLDTVEATLEDAVPLEVEPDVEVAPIAMSNVQSFSNLLPIVTSEPDLLPTIDDSNVEDRLERSLRLAQLEEAVSDSLGRAIAQGLLDAVESDDGPPQEEGLSALEQLLVDAAELRGPGVSARTSVDGSSNESSTQLTIFPDQHQCPGPSMFAIEEWGEDTPFTFQLANRRNGLIGEFDRPNPGAIESLAKLYIHFGFGREAKAALKIDGEVSTNRRILTTLSEIVDEDPIEDQNFVKNISCEGRPHFWGLLAHDEGRIPVTIDANSIVQTFQALPVTLQTHLAPRVAEKLRQSGNFDAARIVLQAVTDTPGMGVDAKIEGTELLVAVGETDAAIDALQETAEQSVRVSPEALLRLLELKIEEEKPIEDSELEALRAFQFERAGTNDYPRLLQMEVRVLRARGKLREAFFALDEFAPSLDPKTFKELNEGISAEIVTRGSDIEFLDFAFNIGLSPQDPNILNQAAERLLGLGFLDKAAMYIAEQTFGAALLERRYLRSELALLNGNPELALAHLAGVQTERANQLRERANNAPQSTSVTGGQPAGTVTALAPSLLESDDPTLQRLGAQLLETPIEPLNSDTPLGSSAELIEQSASLRNSIDDLLNGLQRQ